MMRTQTSEYQIYQLYKDDVCGNVQKMMHVKSKMCLKA